MRLIKLFTDRLLSAGHVKHSELS